MSKPVGPYQAPSSPRNLNPVSNETRKAAVTATANSAIQIFCSGTLLYFGFMIEHPLLGRVD